VQARLRRGFARWGRPGRLRVDNGFPWGSKGDLPTDLALWLIGLGLDVLWNPPRRPQRNGVVERAQGTGRRWSEPGTCDGPEELEARFVELDRLQREEYPWAGGRSRLEACPDLRHSGRPYTVAWERAHWDLARVWEHLAGYAVPRKVNPKGMVSVYNRDYYVGRRHRGQTVYVTFDPQAGEWVAVDAQDRQLRRWPAPELTRQRIVRLEVTHRRPPRAGGKR